MKKEHLVLKELLRAPDKSLISTYIGMVKVIYWPNSMFDHLLESYLRNESNKWLKT